MIWLLFGAPGSGKGTQSKMIEKQFGFNHLSTGDMFRKHLKEESVLGKTAKSFMDKGNLVPDELVIDMVSAELNVSESFILDGFPRTLDQGKALTKMTDSKSLKISGVIYLDVLKSELVKRLTGRRVCVGCGEVFHNETSPTKVEGVCDKCGSEVIQRKDDSLEVIEHRLSVYTEQTSPLMSYYEKKGLLQRIDGLGTANEVFARVERVLN